MCIFHKTLQDNHIRKSTIVGHRKRRSAVFVQPCPGIWTCRLACVLFFEGIVIGGLYQSRRYAAVPDGTWDVCMNYIHDPPFYHVGEIGCMAIYLDLEAIEVFVMLDSCLHDTLCYRKRNARSGYEAESKGMPLFLKGFVCV